MPRRAPRAHTIPSNTQTSAVLNPAANQRGPRARCFLMYQEPVMTDKKARLAIDGKDLDLPVYSGTIGPDVVDVGALVGKGYFTYDPGFVSTAACESKITYIDGDQDVLLHRGYPIEQ